MHQRYRIIISLISLAVLATGSVYAAELSLVIGTIISPAGANEGDTIPPKTEIQTGENAMVMVEHRWRSDVQSRDCILVVIFGYGATYTVSDNETPGRCETTIPANPEDFQSGQPFLASETRYGDAKFDEAKVPDKVKTSQSQWTSFHQWARNTQRTFWSLKESIATGLSTVDGFTENVISFLE